MAILHVERLGGLANFGGMHARIRSSGQLDTDTLSKQDLQVIDSLFLSSNGASADGAGDAFRYRISRQSATGIETIEAPESSVPGLIASCVKDEFV